MARHRNVRGYNYDDDFVDDDLYGQSMEDDYCISPATAAQFIYSKRDRHSSFTEPLEEEEDEDVQDKPRASLIALSSVDQARLYSCLDHMREVLGETVPEQIMIDAVLQCQFDVAKALDLVFKQDCKTSMKPERKDLPAAGRPAKGALFTSLHSLCNDRTVTCPLKDNSECFERSQFTCHAPPKKQTSAVSGDLIDDKRENILSNVNSNLSLSSLINETSNQNLCSGKPAALSEMSLFDLISNPAGNTSTSQGLDLSMTKLSDIATWHSEEIPGLTPLQENCSTNRSLNLAVGNDPVICDTVSSLDNLHEISFMKHIGQENNTLLCKHTNLFGSLSSVLQSEHSDSYDGESVSVPDGNNLSGPKYGSPSLADLIQEYKQRNPLQDISFDNPQKNLCNTQMQTGSLVPLSQLSNQPSTMSDLPSLTKSLSSLAVAQTSDPREARVSLSFLTTETDKPVHDAIHGVFQSSTLLFTEADTNIDLRSLISKPVDSDITKPTTCEQLDSKPASRKFTDSESMIISKQGGHWVRSLKAKPSAFALSMCFTCIPKACKKKISMIPQDHHNNPMTVASELGQPALIPFDFQAPSPDDIVKESQKKAFMR
ncbi:HBS1-like protein isoform X2 [Pseudophryne corroboree]|uniref:HBS1-like protein isoform X2 n=1 Tax=Pseudophryne corroboree TaxID=495146 RepID=UPI0030814477